MKTILQLERISIWGKKPAVWKLSHRLKFMIYVFNKILNIFIIKSIKNDFDEML